jgi:hypothetical protein
MTTCSTGAAACITNVSFDSAMRFVAGIGISLTSRSTTAPARLKKPEDRIFKHRAYVSTRRLCSETCQKPYASNSASAVVGALERHWQQYEDQQK